MKIKSLHQNISDGSSTQQEIMWENRTGHGLASMGISNPPSWTVSLPCEPSQILQLQEPTQVFKGLPLLDTIEEPHKPNYEYLVSLISFLKQKAQIRCLNRRMQVARVGVPKTIDNDILHMDKTFGVDTSVEEAQRAINSTYIEIHLAVVDCIEKLVPDDNIQDIIAKDINTYKIVVGILGRNLEIRARDKMLPVDWWSTYGKSFLNLSHFSIRLLSQTCSSLIGSGRNLSRVEQVYESKNSIERQRLIDFYLFKRTCAVEECKLETFASSRLQQHVCSKLI